MDEKGSRELQAKKYMEEHNILELLTYLTSMLLFFQPDDPRRYLVTILERLRIAKITGVSFPFFMDHTNIVSMFEMLDRSNKGSITFKQYKEALNTLGLCAADEDLKDNGRGITLETFRTEVNDRTIKIWNTF
ncbi:EF-hand calcium-binding domain-containing protein 10 [Sorex fumeus]|uniref:EF-hand calcium-binding domain-containing protein 10 n=1 Tax=Sorex fumeus TaxID=62283 RepID=UPI0024AE115B|nr:EF-hand calcium-binding domain-containing protein 10 [Sorex fumeus]